MKIKKKKKKKPYILSVNFCCPYFSFSCDHCLPLKAMHKLTIFLLDPFFPFLQWILDLPFKGIHLILGKSHLSFHLRCIEPWRDRRWRSHLFLFFDRIFIERSMTIGWVSLTEVNFVYIFEHVGINDFEVPATASTARRMVGRVPGIFHIFWCLNSLPLDLLSLSSSSSSSFIFWGF